MRYPISNVPFGLDGKDTLRIVLQPRKVESQNGMIANKDSIIAPITGTPMEFVAPYNFQEDIQHSWENYDSMATNLAQKFTGASKKLGSAENLAKSVKNNDKSLMSTAGGSVVTKKLDTPLTFKDSNRRQLTFLFMLADQGDPENDVFVPVRTLQQMSCAENKKLLDFEFPNIFEVYSKPSDLIYIEYAALTSVQPSWYGPYRNGWPTKCELTVTFKDLLPLYQQSFSR